MSFRPARPSAELTDGWTTIQWTAWLNDLGVVHSIGPNESRTCGMCCKPMPVLESGYVYPTCYPCGHHYAPYLRRVVPISFSVSAGLTSLVAQAKEEGDRSWVYLGLASMLWDFLHAHWSCLEHAAGGLIDGMMTIPSHPGKRGGRDHLAVMRDCVSNWPMSTWVPAGVLINRSGANAETRRNSVDVEQFAIEADSNVAGKRFLLIDDMCTSGSTTASAAYALRNAGAERPLAVTLGRHISTGDANAASLLAELPTRRWEVGTCPVHVTAPSPFTRPSLIR
jgi:predicted amidophosphoribosyltransferase